MFSKLTPFVDFWKDTVMDNIDDKHVEYPHDCAICSNSRGRHNWNNTAWSCAKKVKSFKTTKRRLSPGILELIRQRGAARATGNQELTPELESLCRETIKEDLKKRKADVLAEAAEAGQSIRTTRRNSPIVKQ